MILNINKLFDDVLIRKHELEFWEREDIINLIMRIRTLLNAKPDIKKDEYEMGEDETLVYILDRLLEIYGIRFFTEKNLKNGTNILS